MAFKDAQQDRDNETTQGEGSWKDQQKQKGKIKGKKGQKEQGKVSKI